MADLTALSAESRDLAQQVATALLHGDGKTAADLVSGVEHCGGLAASLAGLLVYVHRCWCTALEADPAEAWSTLMLDLEERRHGA